jgi:ClpP class serine protease
VLDYKYHWYYNLIINRATKLTKQGKNKMNTQTQYWADIADKHIANIDKLVARYENATNENYQLILDQIKSEEKARDHAEAMFDKAMM